MKTDDESKLLAVFMRFMRIMFLLVASVLCANATKAKNHGYQQVKVRIAADMTGMYHINWIKFNGQSVPVQSSGYTVVVPPKQYTLEWSYRSARDDQSHTTSTPITIDNKTPTWNILISGRHAEPQRMPY